MTKQSNSALRSFVERIENIEAEIKERNSDKSDIYAEAKSSGFDVKALKVVIARRRKDPSELQEHDALVDLYLVELDRGTVPATRACTTQPAPKAIVEQPAPVTTFSIPAIAGDIHNAPEYDLADIPKGLDRRVSP